MSGSSPSGNRIRVLAPGLLTTVQDLGRYGYAHLGVSASGAADPLSFRLGNLIVGNPENTPALEMTLVGGAFEFESEAVVCLVGSDFGVPLWTPIRLQAGGTLRCGATRSGARCYLCVRGGIEIPLVLGSASTHVTTGLGGRVLRKGDVLEVGDRASHPVRRIEAPPAWDRSVLRVTAGPQRHWFRDTLGCYEVAEESNRMGLRLKGPKLAYRGEMLTEGVSLGSVQVPPEGQPIVLFVEHQTTGGYPKIANVIAADLPAVGQLRPRDTVRFEEVSLETAMALKRVQEDWLHSHD